MIRNMDENNMSSAGKVLPTRDSSGCMAMKLIVVVSIDKMFTSSCIQNRCRKLLKHFHQFQWLPNGT